MYKITFDDIKILRKRASKLAQIIKNAKSNIRIFSGEGAYIYNSSEVLTAIYTKKEGNPEFNITVSIGPCLYGEAKIRDNKLTKFNGLLQLAEENLINLYFRETRTKNFHFCIADDGKLYSAEEFHPCMTPFSKKKPKYLSEKELKDICKNFDAQLGKWNNKLEDDSFLILTDAELELLIKYTTDSKIDYDKLQLNEIKQKWAKLDKLFY